jgi:hypothetical protein
LSGRPWLDWARREEAAEEPRKVRRFMVYSVY